MKVLVSNILDLVRENGEESVMEYLSDFSCVRDIDGQYKSLNPDIERFIKQNAVSFAQKKSICFLCGNRRGRWCGPGILYNCS